MTTVTNYINYSQQIDQWTASNTTVDTGISDPNGGTDAQRVNFNASGSYRIINADTTINAGESATGSIWVRNPTSSTANIAVSRKFGIGSFERTLLLVPLTSQWTRIEVTHTYSNNQSGSRFDILGNSGSIEVFGAQLEYNVSQASNYYVLTTTDAPRTVDLTTLISGWGRGTWSEGSWGAALPVTVSGNTASTNIGSVTVAIGQQINATGLSLSTNIESVTLTGTANVFPTTTSAQVLIGEETPVVDVTVIPTSLLLQTSLGTVEALRLQGVTAQTNVGTVDIQAGGNVFVNAAENGLQTNVGQVVERITVDAFVDGVSAQINIGEETTQANANVTVTALTLSANIEGVIIDLNTPVDVTGDELNTFIGEEIPAGNANVDLTGQSLSTAIGDVDAVSKIQVTGVSATFDIGNVSIQANTDVPVTGNQLNTATSASNVIAWAEVNTGTQVTWTEVDIAA